MKLTIVDEDYRTHNMFVSDIRGHTIFYHKHYDTLRPNQSDLYFLNYNRNRGYMDAVHWLRIWGKYVPVEARVLMGQYPDWDNKDVMGSYTLIKPFTSADLEQIIKRRER